MNLHSLFSWVNISQADVDQVPRRQDRFHPGQSWNIGYLWQKNDVVGSHRSQRGLFRQSSESVLEQRQCEYKGLRPWNSKDNIHIVTWQSLTLLFTLSCNSFSRKETGWPWRFPDGEVIGVLRSAWASTQMTQRSGHCWACPPTDPIPRLEEEDLHQYLLPEGAAACPLGSVTCGRLPAWQACTQPPQPGSRHPTASCWLHPHCEESWCPCRARLPQWCESWGHQSHRRSSLGTNVGNQLAIPWSAGPENNSCYLFLTLVRLGAQLFKCAALQHAKDSRVSAEQRWLSTRSSSLQRLKFQSLQVAAHVQMTNCPLCMWPAR